VIDLRFGDAVSVLRSLPDESIDAVLTDPPYGTDSPKDGYGRRSLGGPNKRIQGDSDLETARSVLREIPRLIRKRSFVLVFCSPKRHAETVAVIRDCDLNVFGEIVWDKKCPGLGGGIRYQHELVLLCGIAKPKGCSAIFSVLRYATPKAGRQHPHEKPIGLIRELVEYASPPGGVVLDPFAGSGTTAVACVQTGRSFVGAEIDPVYFAIAQQRINAHLNPALSA
jgi:DNA modification methylase